MKPEVTLKYLSYVANKKNKGEEGFTLIELLVVVIIIGVLAAVALPNLLNQVGKARETEIKNAVGTINRTQQSYHFERQSFASAQSLLGVSIPTQYIDDIDGAIDNGGGAGPATFEPENASFAEDGTRAYSGAIGFAAGVYTQAICQSDEPIATIGAPTDSTTCPAASVLVK